MKKYLSMLILLFANMVHAQKCGTITDNAHILDAAKLQESLKQMRVAGIDPHIYTNTSMENSANAHQYSETIVNRCKDFQDQTGKAETNLVLFTLVVGPGLKKLDVFYGEDLQRSLTPTYATILSDMRPSLSHGQYNEGISTGATDIALAYKTSHSIVGNGGVVKIDNHQAVDYSGLWQAISWIIVIGFLFALGWIFYKFMSRRNAIKSGAKEAQKIARTQKSAALDAIKRMEDAIDPTSATADADRMTVRTIQARLDGLTQSVKFDVNADLTAEEYRYIGECYQRISDQINGFHSSGFGAAPIANEEVTNEPVRHVPRKHYSSTHTSTVRTSTRYISPPAGIDVEYIPVPMVIEPVFIPEPVYVPEDDYHRTYTPEPEREDSYSSNDNSSGGSIDFSDSGSSDSGGSMDFGSNDSSSDF